MSGSNSIILWIDLFGTASFAVSGAIRALDRRPDFIGMLILAGVTAIGGSVLRDVILNRDPVTLQHMGYPLAILLAVALVWVFPGSVSRRQSWLLYTDAIGLGVFSAFTAALAWNKPGMNPLSVLMLSTFVGCAGGVIRDLIIGKQSLVLANELYVTPMIIGTAALMGVKSLGAHDFTGLMTAMVVTTVIRVLAIWFDWRLPRILHVGAGHPQPTVASEMVNPETEKKK